MPTSPMEDKTVIDNLLAPTTRADHTNNKLHPPTDKQAATPLSTMRRLVTATRNPMKRQRLAQRDPPALTSNAACSTGGSGMRWRTD